MIGREHIDSFLTRNRWNNAEKTYLKSDASKRRYIRLELQNKSVLLMDAFDVKEIVDPFVRIALHLKKYQFSVPDVFDVDYYNGLVLIEDLGDNTFSKHLSNKPNDIFKLYKAAIDILVIFREVASTSFIPIYTKQFFSEELSEFLNWYLPYMGIETSERLKEDFIKSWEDPLKYLIENSKKFCFVHKDFHCNNLLWLPDRGAKRNIGIIDFQSARFGSNLYDLISILYDCRNPVSVEQREKIFRYYCIQTNFSYDHLLLTCKILIVQRNIKILGNFAKVNILDSKSTYLRYLPIVWEIIYENLEEPIFAEFRYWLKTYFLISKSS